MALFNRSKGKLAPPPAHFRVPEGSAACQADGCTHETGVQCVYVDRRGRTCHTTWCPQHWSVVGGAIYCRRHATTMRALGESASDPLSLPDIDNRGPSLVEWIANQLDPAITELLARVAQPGETVTVEADVRVTFDRSRQRRFERSWKLVHFTGINLKVTVLVHEDADDTVLVMVGWVVVAKGVPPWIARRLAGKMAGPGIDAAERELFYGFLQEHITKAVEEQRADLTAS